MLVVHNVSWLTLAQSRQRPAVQRSTWLPPMSIYSLPRALVGSINEATHSFVLDGVCGMPAADGFPLGGGSCSPDNGLFLPCCWCSWDGESVSVNEALGEELCVCVLVRCFIFYLAQFFPPTQGLDVCYTTVSERERQRERERE